MALATKTLGPFTFKIDRPKGTVKKWPTKTFTYPCDYGYFPRLKGEDEEGLDAFVGDDPGGHLESFLKLRPDEHGRLVPDETKFLLGVSDRERETIYRLYGTEVSQRKVYADFDEVRAALERFQPKRRKTASVAARYGLKLAASARYGVKFATLYEIVREMTPESIDVDQKMQDVFRTADARPETTGEESAVGMLPEGGTVG
jgi:hypothetical protein